MRVRSTGRGSSSGRGCVVMASRIGLAGRLGEATADPMPTLRPVERGRVALTLKGFLKPEWSEAPIEMRAGSGTSRPPTPITIRRLCRRHSAIAMACTRPLSQRRAADGPAAGYRPGRGQERAANRLHGLPRRLDRRPELCRPGEHPARPEGAALRADDGRRPAAAALHVRAQLVARDQQRRPDRRRAAEPAQRGPLVPHRSRCRWGSTSPRWTRPPGGT